MSGRAKLFDEDDPEPDLSQFAPRVDDAPAPPLTEVREISAAAGFPSRDAGRPMTHTPAPPLIPERHYYRTGRDTQFNTKVRPDVKAAFVAIAAEDGIPIGKVLEDALDALMRERKGRDGP
jgi:hypothetical protein